MYTLLLFTFVVATVVFFASSLRSYRQRDQALKQYLDSSYILEHLADGVIEFDSDLTISRLNASAEQIFGVNRSEIIGKKLIELKAGGLTELAGLIKKAVADSSADEPAVQELTIRTPEEKRLKIFTIPKITAAGGKPLGFILVTHDITREEIIARNKTSLVTIVSHQLRTPISGVKWILKALLDGDFGDLNPEQTNLVARGVAVAENTIGLVDDMLDVASIEESDFRYNFSRQDLISLCRELVREHGDEARGRNIKIVENYAVAKIEIDFDYKRLRIALGNLLTNGIHYSPDGGTVSLTVAADSKNATVSIEDSGIGVPADARSYIFNKFFRAENAKKLKPRGTGLGLFLVKKIAEGHGGSVWFQSYENIGSTFYIRLPLNNKV